MIKIDEIRSPQLRNQLYQKYAEAGMYQTPAPVPSKYRNRKVRLDGHVFDSVKEAWRYVYLRSRLRRGEIEQLAMHVKIRCDVAGLKVCNYICDFKYYDKQLKRYVVEDVKSERTRTLATYRLKRRLVKVLHGIDIVEV